MYLVLLSILKAVDFCAINIQLSYLYVCVCFAFKSAGYTSGNVAESQLLSAMFSVPAVDETGIEPVTFNRSSPL